MLAHGGFSPVPRESRGAPTIGRPIANTQVYVLDRHQQPVPIGIPGELYLGGVQLARGYLDRPDLTAEKFIPDPFAAPEDRGARLADAADHRGDLPEGRADRHRADRRVRRVGRQGAEPHRACRARPRAYLASRQPWRRRSGRP